MGIHSKKIALTVMVLISLCFSASSAMAFSHYVPGSMGLKNASAPPPGFYYVNYGAFYSADTYKNDSGDTVDGLGLDLTVYANVSQFFYMSGKKFLGADYGVDLFVPFVYTDIQNRAAGIDEDTFELGDIFIDPLILGWHWDRWDAFIAAGAYIPTGNDDHPSSAGKGYYTFMEQVGATYYFDAAKTWTASARARFEQSTEKSNSDVTPGDELIFEYGVAKDIPAGNNMLWTLGISGYSYTQLSADSGTGASPDKFSGHGIGPEVQLMIFKPLLSFSLRYAREYGVENNTQGDSLCLTITAGF